jgi:hypothetical protein
VTALLDIDSAEDPASAHYKATLHEQLVKAVVHLGTLMSAEDFARLGGQLVDRTLAAIATYVHQFAKICDKTSTKSQRSLAVLQIEVIKFIENVNRHLGSVHAESERLMLQAFGTALEYLKSVVKSM